MRIHSALILFSIVLLPHLAFAQELSYTHYDTKNGLAGSTVYCSTLDKDGFLWFGTENGLSRFDGTHFKNFTTRDGLPDNEILELFTDSRGRVWMAPFRNEICYYYKGVIHTAENDTTLAKVKLLSNIRHFAEDAHGNILISDYSRSRLYLVAADNEVKNISTINSRFFNKIGVISKSPQGNFWVLENDTLYEFANGFFRSIAEIDSAGILDKQIFLANNFLAKKHHSDELELKNLISGKKIIIPYPHTLFKYTIVNDSLVALCKNSGIDVINTKTLAYLTYLEGRPVTDLLIDKEGSLWFTTLGQGICRLNSQVVKNFGLPEISNSKPSISAIFKIGSKIIAGASLSALYEVNVDDGLESIVQKGFAAGVAVVSEILDVKELSNGDWIFFESSQILKSAGNFAPDKGVRIPTKSVSWVDKTKFVVATPSCTLIFDPYSFRILDTIWNQRTTAVYYRNDTFFIGALDGLHLLVRGKPAKHWGASVLSFKNRITAIKESADGTLWIATYGDGLLAYKNNRIITHLTTDDGLTSNICRNIFIDGNKLWVGTDKGLNKISFKAEKASVTQYTTSDGIASDIINAVFVENSMVFVGTREGLTFFDEQKINSNSRCDLRLTGISVSGNSFSTDSSNFNLPHNKNNIQFNFVGISYRSAGDITYRYRLIGLDSVWQTTRETYLSYPTLPSGDYVLELQATNKFGVNSDIMSLPFSVEKLLWEKTWFKSLLILAIAAFVWLLLNLRIRHVRRNESEKQKIAKKITELEQLALKSQMNPHFIFNSLNSIQQYVMDKDIAGANKFISGFSRLMRQTLFFSAKSHINLADEITYLTTYLELEKDRLENAFTYQVITGQHIYPHDYLIPPMILQPYVENSVRHGVRYRKDHAGVILISVTKQDSYLVCVIEDNGIGRKMSRQLKGNTTIEYQSKGMSLTSDRIKLINESSAQKIEVMIEDLEDETAVPRGTRVTVRFPVIEN
ncbi:sensor histidine kinase [Foetidibacter luteolus]|uniref:sensor histidine kinase n=1 Tax=Foetidibacter luteolus TaxID=2608880 RepID=UPI001A994B98|nr:two-component regulator propeller domain-containing protein [Foetidibacter luteolus]